MAYYDINVLLALPSGRCTCPEKDCLPCTILEDRDKVRMQMSRWTSPLFREKEPNDPRPIYKFYVNRNEAECVTIVEGKETPDLGDVWILDLINGASRSRLTIFGHGDKSSKTVGGRSPLQLAKLITEGCRIRRVTKVSLLACYGGGNFNVAAGQPGHVAVNDSFAKDFHAELVLANQGRQLYTDVSARTRAIGTDGSGKRVAHIPDAKSVYKAPNTKFTWHWIDTVDGCKEQRVSPR